MNVIIRCIDLFKSYDLRVRLFCFIFYDLAALIRLDRTATCLLWLLRIQLFVSIQLMRAMGKNASYTRPAQD